MTASLFPLNCLWYLLFFSTASQTSLQSEPSFLGAISWAQALLLHPSFMPLPITPTHLSPHCFRCQESIDSQMPITSGPNSSAQPSRLSAPRPTLSTSPYFPKAPNMTWSRETAQVSILHSCHNRPTFVLFLCFLSYLETSFSFILTCKPSSNIHHPLSRSRLPQLHPNRSSYT